jgi:hypothetical protein
VANGGCMSLLSELIRFLFICLALASLVYALQDTFLPHTMASSEHREVENTFEPIVFER